MEKEILVNNNRVLFLNVINNEDNKEIIIEEKFLVNDQIKCYQLAMKNDYLFLAISDCKDDNRMTFSFDLDHPLYYSLKKILKNDDKLIITDDYSTKDKMKYMQIYITKDDIINIEFIDNEKKESDDKYSAILINMKSKNNEDSLDTILRLYTFFNDSALDILNGYHQYEFDEIIKEKKLIKQ